MDSSELLLLVVAVLWGGTNPFIKKGSRGIENIKKDSVVDQKVSEFLYLFTRWQYLIPFALNQLGSVIFYHVLQKADLSLAVPITNSLSFVVTAIVSRIFGDQKITLLSYIGLGLIFMGTTVCMVEKDGTFEII